MTTINRADLGATVCRALMHEMGGKAIRLDTPICASVVCDHTETVTGGYEAIGAALGPEEYDRLYDLALETERR